MKEFECKVVVKGCMKGAEVEVVLCVVLRGLKLDVFKDSFERSR